MQQHIELQSVMRHLLGAHHELTPVEIGKDAHLARYGLTFETAVWKVEEVGHLCSMRMRAPLNVMQMETVVLAPTCVDMPLANFDWVKAFGSETQIMEVYDTQLAPWPDAIQRDLALISERDADLASSDSKEAHWYDEILYPCSYHRKGKGACKRLSNAAIDFMTTYVDQLDATPPCDSSAKSERVRAFAERLFEEGGPAVSMVTKLFGQETGRRLVVEHMYGAS